MPLLFFALFLLAVRPGEATAQFVVAGGVGWYEPRVDLLPDLDGGPGWDASFRVEATGWLEPGAGVQYHRHTIGGGSDVYEVLVPFLELRLLPEVGSDRWRPFVAPRAGWVRHTLTLFDREVSGTGDLVGGMAGVELRLTGSFHAEAVVAWYRARVTEVDFDLAGIGLGLEDLSADVPGARVGLTWRP